MVNSHPLGARRAFTLVELLTVIGIIALLAAILFPVLAASRALARRTTCTSNLRQVGLALRMYEQDYEAFPPDFQTVAAYVKTPALLHCPSDPTPGHASLQEFTTDQHLDPFLPLPLGQRPASLFSYYYAPKHLAPPCLTKVLADNQAGTVACLLHGQSRNVGIIGHINYEGTLLRLRNDGGVAVLQRTLYRPDKNDFTHVESNPYTMFSDDKTAPCGGNP